MCNNIGWGAHVENVQHSCVFRSNTSALRWLYIFNEIEKNWMAALRYANDVTLCFGSWLTLYRPQWIKIQHIFSNFVMAMMTCKYRRPEHYIQSCDFQKNKIKMIMNQKTWNQSVARRTVYYNWNCFVVRRERAMNGFFIHNLWDSCHLRLKVIANHNNIVTHKFSLAITRRR